MNIKIYSQIILKVENFDRKCEYCFMYIYEYVIMSISNGEDMNLFNIKFDDFQIYMKMCKMF